MAANHQACLACSDLSYAFDDGTLLFDSLSFSLSREKCGLVGPNGVGKSTLLKLLTGELEPSRGSVRSQGRIGYLPQLLWSADEKCVKEVLLEEERWSPVALELDINQLEEGRPLASLSGGELVKLRLAGLLVREPSILVLDEPTNNLDEDGRATLMSFLERWRGCALIVSHDRDLLSQMDCILELSSRGLRTYGGGFDFYEAQRAIEDRALESQITTATQSLKREKRDLQQAHERQTKRMNRGNRQAKKGGLPKIIAGGLKRKAEISLARSQGTHETRLQQAELTLSSAKSERRARNQIQVDLPDTSVPGSKCLVEVRDFNFRHTASESPLFPEPLSFAITGPERVAIAGPNGAGKTTLIRLILESGGTLDLLPGEKTGEALLKTERVSYLDQQALLLDPERTLLENLMQTAPHLTESECRIRLGRFLFDRQAMDRKVATLSGGERLRAALACVLFSESPPQLLILDEPTNNLDLDSIERLESALSKYEGAILVVSHDRTFLENISVTKEIQLTKHH